MNHQDRVAANFPVDTVEHLVALYHDHIEDGLGDVPDEARPHVEVLTRDDEDYFDYIRRVRDSRDAVAIAVKRADIHDNMARSKGMYDGVADEWRWRHYARALGILDGSAT